MEDTLHQKLHSTLVSSGQATRLVSNICMVAELAVKLKTTQYEAFLQTQNPAEQSGCISFEGNRKCCRLELENEL